MRALFQTRRTQSMQARKNGNSETIFVFIFIYKLGIKFFDLNPVNKFLIYNPVLGIPIFFCFGSGMWD